MNLISKLVLVIAFLLSTSTMAASLVVKCDVKFKNSPRSKLVKLRVNYSGSNAMKSFKLKKARITMIGVISGKKYGTKLKILFELKDLTLTDRIVSIGGIKRPLNRVSYGNLGRIVVPGVEGGPKLIANCNI